MTVTAALESWILTHSLTQISAMTFNLEKDFQNVQLNGMKYNDRTVYILTYPTLFGYIDSTWSTTVEADNNDIASPIVNGTTDKVIEYWNGYI